MSRDTLQMKPSYMKGSQRRNLEGEVFDAMYYSVDIYSAKSGGVFTFDLILLLKSLR